MTLEIWLAYAAACMVLLIIPGPTILLVVSYALSGGRRSAWYSVPGVALGDTTAVTLSLLGVGALLAVSAELFTVLKWVGAAYLVYLGIKMIRSRPALEAPELEEPDRAALKRSQRWIFWHCTIVTALNPKGIVFFVAFLPQFIVPEAPVVPQMLLLGGTFVGLAVVNCVLYALIAGSIRDTVGQPGVLKTINRLGGGILIGAGAMMAAVQRSG